MFSVVREIWRYTNTKLRGAEKILPTDAGDEKNQRYTNISSMKQQYCAVHRAVAELVKTKWCTLAFASDEAIKALHNFSHRAEQLKSTKN